MIKVNVTTNMPDVAARVRELGRQGNFAAAVALTRTAQDVRSTVRTEMGRVFDRPTEYTLNGMFLKGATRDNLEARVWLKDNPFGKGTPADRYLAPHIFAGGRSHKGMEKALQAYGFMRRGQYAVPAAGAQLDANGNVKRAQIIQILSQLRVQIRAGYESRASSSTASRRTVARQGVVYFALPEARRGLQPGIYLRRRFAHGSAVRPVFLFVPQVQYHARLRFFEIGDATARRRFPGHFEAEHAKAVATARLR